MTEDELQTKIKEVVEEMMKKMVKILESTDKAPLEQIGRIAGICWDADVTCVEKTGKEP